MLDRKELKSHARSLIIGGRISPLLITLVYIAVTGLLNYISLLFEYGPGIFQELQLALEQGEAYIPSESIPAPTFISTFVPVLIMLIAPVIQTGYRSYCMGIYRGERTGFSALLDGLGVAGKVIWCDILMSVRVMLWSMLFVIPGIVALYRYRFAMYNIIRDPSLSAGAAIALSCRQTEGMKMDLFLMDLSFLGWHILALFTGSLLNVWVLPYVTFTELGYYHLALRNVPTEQSEQKPDHFEP